MSDKTGILGRTASCNGWSPGTGPLLSGLGFYKPGHFCLLLYLAGGEARRRIMVLEKFATYANIPLANDIVPVNGNREQVMAAVSGKAHQGFGNTTSMSKTPAKTIRQHGVQHRQRPDRLPSFSLNTADFAAKERRDVWSDTNSPNFSMSAVDGGPFNVDARFTAWTASDLTLIDISFNPTNGTSCTVNLNSIGSEMVALRYCKQGAMPGIIADDTVSLDPNHICLVDQQRDFHGITAGLGQMSVYVPYDLIGYDPARDPAARSIAIDTPTGRVLHSVMTCAFGSLANLNAADGRSVVAGLKGAIRGFLNTDQHDEQTRRDFEATRKAAMKKFIHDNLHNPDLSVTCVCSAFGASRATAFRTFKPSGGIQRYIMNRRLDRAYSLLSRSPEERGQIIQTAYKCGFTDTSLFFRAFRARFGTPPGEVLGQHFAGSTEANDIEGIVLLQDQRAFISRLFG